MGGKKGFKAYPVGLEEREGEAGGRAGMEFGSTGWARELEGLLKCLLITSSW